MAKVDGKTTCDAEQRSYRATQLSSSEVHLVE